MGFPPGGVDAPPALQPHGEGGHRGEVGIEKNHLGLLHGLPGAGVHDDPGDGLGRHGGGEEHRGEDRGKARGRPGHQTTDRRVQTRIAPHAAEPVNTPGFSAALR